MSTFRLLMILHLFNISLARAQDYSGSGDVSLADGINTTRPEGASIESTWPGAAVGAGAFLGSILLIYLIFWGWEGFCTKKYRQGETCCLRPSDLLGFLWSVVKFPFLFVWGKAKLLKDWLLSACSTTVIRELDGVVSQPPQPSHPSQPLNATAAPDEC